MGVAQAGAAHEAAVRPVPEGPDPVPVTVPVVQVIPEVAGGLLVGAETAQGRHDPGIAVHAPDIGQVSLAQALCEKPVGPEGLYRSAPVRPRHHSATITGRTGAPAQ